MDWCVQPFRKANHHPVAAFNGDGSDTNPIASLHGYRRIVIGVDEIVVKQSSIQR